MVASEVSRQWVAQIADDGRARALAHELDLPPLLGGLLINRGHDTADKARAFLEPSVDDLREPQDLAGMDAAADRLCHAVLEGETILIHGDADVDGLSGTALLVQFLRSMGSQPKVYVPNRAYDGYSFGEAGLTRIAEVGARVVISVDNGITSNEPIARLQDDGVDVLLTDHHLPGDTLPPAHAVVNPHRADCTYGFKGLSGVGVAFKLCCATATRLGAAGRNGKVLAAVLGEILAWVSMGTVSDVMPLRDENRVLVARGLRALRLNTTPGLRALCAVCGMGAKHEYRTEDIAFQIAPRLNAASRMGQSDLSVELLTTTDPKRAATLAGQLDTLNRERRAAERVVLEEILPKVDALDEQAPAVLFSDSWTTGLLGLVAGRIARRRGRPAVLVSSANGSPAKGSVRSVVGFDAHAALNACDEYLVGHGGHAMAAGFSIEPDAMEPFAERFRELWAAHVAGGLPAPPHEYEGELPLAAVTAELVRAVERLEPFGEGNQRPILGLRDVSVSGARDMGGGGQHLQLVLSQGDKALRAVAFDKGELAPQLHDGARIDVLFHPKINRFRGRSRVELEIVDLRPSAGV